MDPHGACVRVFGTNRNLSVGIDEARTLSMYMVVLVEFMFFSRTNIFFKGVVGPYGPMGPRVLTYGDM